MLNYKNVLVAIDVYENYQPLLNEAKKFADRQQAKLSCIYVMPGLTSSVPYAYDFQRAVENEAANILAKIQQDMGIETTLLLGSSSSQICDHAKKISADLLICGSHGRHGIGLILGSTANGILHTANCDVLTIRLDNRGQCTANSNYNQIILASNLKEESKKLATIAKDLAQNYQARLRIVHAINYVTATAAAYYPEIEADLKKEAEQSMLQFSQDLGVDLINTEIHFGAPKQVILSAANNHNAELIVIGSHGKSALASAFLGSTANAVLHGANCNILVVRL
ncbi:MAG: universal stress family protein [Gammaproteobacteria bacterium]|jgi:universal stress protein A|nr:universal stress family protein [Gammaproteobacteria bacterium]